MTRPTFPLLSLLQTTFAVCGLCGLFTASHATAEIDPTEMELVRKIHASIVAAHQAQSEATMNAYSATIPGSSASFEMVPVEAGEFRLGSPEEEKGGAPDEGPQRRVAVSAFWIGKTPITWNAFELFMYPERGSSAGADPEVDAVSRPTPPYVDMSFGMGKEGYPAISMTHHAASKFCQWLSARTGHFYRLPTEAEWEYAARAGTTTAWSFGDDPEDLGDYAWYAANSEWKTHPVGTKKPNPWGLHDMHGNVWEWTLDQYSPDGYQKLEDGAVNPWNKPTTEYPRVVRGGSWYDDATESRSASRRPSDPDWKAMDPQLPQSVWFHTEALWLGFRIVRPAEIPSAEEMYEYWNR